MEKAICGANKKGKKGKCKNKPMANGKCRFHGGLSTGPKDKAKHSASLRGNKNALKTGEYETISYHTLSDDEKYSYELIPDDPVIRLSGKIKMLEIRANRFMKRQALVTDDDELIKLDAALIRIDARASEYERLLEQLESKTTKKEDGSLDQLCGILNTIREQRQKKN
ncbi:HGGxSTG domain-containing protein [Bacillus sp. JJ864]|uniref:HGGxSTG domain-containing protein n=1 Tax=Bacillus sp. JJ864 TaxID=3122975 RepID=UPI002FFF577C